LISYVSEIPYVSEFTSELSPDWLDFVAVVNGIEPPDRDERFAWCELGCGLGVTANVLAAANPNAVFVGIDALPAHIASAQALSNAAGTSNLRLHELDFEAAVEVGFPPFQYIVAHGVYAWIDKRASDALRRFISRHLAPDGLVYISYNAMPGWAANAPFQHLISAFAARNIGCIRDRFDVAARKIQELTQAGAPPLRASTIATEWHEYAEKREPAYLIHEYLAPAWRPLYVDQVRQDMREIALSPAGSAILVENFDSLVLRRTAREALREIEDSDLRELARDYFLVQNFRRDVFTASSRRLDVENRRARLLNTHFARLRPAEAVALTMQTQAGSISFDNAVARTLVASSSIRGCKLRDLPGNESDLVANALALCCARGFWPAETSARDMTQLNEALFRNTGGDAAYYALPFGTALRFSRRFVEALRHGNTPEAASWNSFLRGSEG
jgi:SAM-dependent methyltransferase